MMDIRVTTSLNFKDYRYLLFISVYKKPALIITLFAGLTMMLSSVMYFTGIFMYFDSAAYFQLVLGSLVVFYLPYAIHHQAAKGFKNNSKLTESITYTFTDAGFDILGDTFSAYYSWGEIYKVVINKRWVLIYTSKDVANIIRIDAFELSDIQLFIRFLQSQQSLRKRIKSD